MADSLGLFVSTAPFAPTDITGLKLWLKADSLSLNNGDPVASWTDSSGSGNDASQGTLGNKPLYKTGIINGLPTVLFDGIDDFMTITSGAPAILPASTFVVIQPTLNTVSQKQYACIYGTGQSSAFIVARIATNFWGTFTSADLSSVNSLTAGSNYLLELTCASGGSGPCILYQRGSQVATDTASVTGTGNSNTGVGKDLQNANRQYAGHIAEIISYNTVLSSGNRLSVETYLKNRYHI